MICDIHLQVPLIGIYWNPSFTGRFVTTSPEVSGTVRAQKKSTGNSHGHPETLCHTRLDHRFSKQTWQHRCLFQTWPTYNAHVCNWGCMYTVILTENKILKCQTHEFAWCKNNSIYRIRIPQHLCGILVYLSVRDYCQTKMKKRPGVALVHGSVSFLNILPVTSTNGGLSKVF